VSERAGERGRAELFGRMTVGALSAASREVLRRLRFSVCYAIERKPGEGEETLWERRMT